MKNNYLPLLIASLLLTLPLFAQAQIGFNSPAGITPKQDVEMYSRNSFLWQQKYRVTTDPNSGVYTMSCPSSTTLTNTAGVLLDPGGTGSYPTNQTCVQVIDTPGSSLSVGYEITFEQFGMAAGDSVFFEDTYGGRIGFSGPSLPPTLLIPGGKLTVRFQSNSDFFSAAGFRFRWRKVYSITGDTFGYAMQFDATNGSLVAGLHGIGTAQQIGRGSSIFGSENSVTGVYSAAFGGENSVSDNYALTAGRYNRIIKGGSVAFGLYNTVNGFGAAAIGSLNDVIKDYSIALGYSNTANGFGAITLGGNNIANGTGTIALGSNNSAGGTGAIAMGSYVSTNGFAGSFNFGDASVLNQTVSTATNQFTARFAGGYRLFSNSATTIGVQLAAGGNAWSAISDSTKKERFQPLNHADLLANIRSLKLGTWNYKGQRTERHYGPMAQDFFARFGHDALGVIGCDTLLNSHDFTAVTLSGVQALALENEQLKAKLAQLKDEHVLLKAEHTQIVSRLEARLEALERRVLIQPTFRAAGVSRQKRVR